MAAISFNTKLIMKLTKKLFLEHAKFEFEGDVYMYDAQELKYGDYDYCCAVSSIESNCFYASTVFMGRPVTSCVLYSKCKVIQ